ncbi:Elongation of very long chain fatty acids protein AAEL008004 [Frankliniella fusca]|uniref:Elongation of very long chain fatty acids protein n=1 Tax=Frankliniella fusca TaxID=407009 RepID=A0AAE1LRX7_9NEOP|nr:Elongation of very long chain fatty acids protein AAEL008004 [Frankliniella fusca]
MTSIITDFVEEVNRLVKENEDPRTKDWFMMGSPWPLVGLLVVYVYTTTSLGPRLMQNRQPFKLTGVLITYNFLQMIGSAMLFWEGLDAAWLRDYDYKCQPIGTSTDPQALRMAGAVWWYFAFKIIELLDTVFFVLRKKNNQLSFLHMYHHTMMPVCAWVGTKFAPGGHGTFIGLVNCLVHVVMYFYYMLAAIPGTQRYLGWKPWVTIVQLVQFVIVFFHASQPLYRQCDYSKVLAGILTVNSVLFMYMFGSFYYRTYILAPKRSQAAALAKDKQAVSNGNGLHINNNNVESAKNHNGKVKSS